MSGSTVRRLVLDISPMARAYVLFMVCCNLLMNYAWISKGPPVLTMGLLFGLAGTLLQQKFAVWRLLPVSKVDLDHARWWLAPGAGLIGLPLLMVLPALVRVLQQRPHLGWDQVALGSLAQIGVCAIFALFQAILPWVTRTAGRWSAVFFLLFLVLTMRMIMPSRDPAEEQRILTLLAAAGLPIALTLYLTAGRWPLPLTGSFWIAASYGKDRSATPASHHRVKGWSALAAGAWPLLAIYLAISVAYPILILIIAPRMNLAAISGIIVFVALQATLFGLLPAIRILRALPLTGWELTVRLCALLGFAELGALLLLTLVVLVLQPRNADGVLRTLPLLPLSFLFIPGALRFGPRIALFGGGLVYIAAQNFLFFAAGIPAGILLAGAAVATLASLFWLWWELTRGTRAYRMVPLMPMRWRGT